MPFIASGNPISPVSGSGDFQRSEVALECFPAVTVPSVARPAPYISVKQVEIHLGVKDAFEQCLVQLASHLVNHC